MMKSSYREIVTTAAMFATLFFGLFVGYQIHTPEVKEVIVNEWPYPIQPFTFQSQNIGPIDVLLKGTIPAEDAQQIRIRLNSTSYYLVYVWPSPAGGEYYWTYTLNTVIIP